MELAVRGDGPIEPFYRARDRFTSEHQLTKPVTVQIKNDPAERTRVGHDEDHHILYISKQAATSALAVELALHEFSHMARHEEAHPSHVQSTQEAIYLGLAGHSIEERRLTQCYQIANHMKDIYADDLTVSVGSSDKLVAFLESKLADGLTTGNRPPRDNLEPTGDGPDRHILAVNAAFAVALVERHDLVGADHRLYDLAHAATADAPDVPFAQFKDRFRTLTPDPDPSDYRKTLVETTQDFALSGAVAAD